MLLRLSEIFISLLIINISEGVLPSITGSSFTKNKYCDSHVILAYNNVGPLMCVSDCMMYKECNAVNFNRQKLECELLAVSFPGDIITDMDGSYYTEIGGWKKDKDECNPNPCEVGQQCIPAMYHNHICLEFDAPCDVNPCYNNGVCRNKVNDYRCICPEGYYGYHCECGSRVFTSSTGSFSSPNYPHPYTNNLYCTYLIRVQSGQRINLAFTSIITEDKYDYLQVFDGSRVSDRRLLNFSGSIDNASIIQSTGNVILVLFTTDGSITKRGFTATYTSHS
ncbi:CUBN [Mytilus edulis]|uniref:CUBN n=1 Tax=Mytilus edulis TaxID=6550 RepID=A0A8S3T4Q4_MYTED|nr:CUBN [Mytilus edulis]